MTQLGEGVFTPVAEPGPTENEENPPLKIRFSVFFDGTLNNRTNIKERESNTAVYQQHKPKPGEDSSYEGDRTNVAIMEEYIDKEQRGDFDHVFSTYIEGIGTDNLEADSARGYALGTGDTGVKEKVEKGLNRVIKILDRGLEKNIVIKELVLDVFGFSRGAAGARYFIHRALSDKRSLFSTPRPLANNIRAKGFEIANNAVRVAFVGLYDTVSSEGLRHNDVKALKLDAIARHDVSTVVHLVAAEEHRTNFALTNIASATKKGGREIFLPGVHSDIGGGYRNDVEETLLLNESHSRAALEQDRQRLLDQGWFKAEQILIESPPPLPPVALPQGGVAPPEVHRLTARRSVADNGYAKIPLNIMAEFYQQTGGAFTSKFQKKATPPAQLSSVYEDLKAYAQQGRSKPEDWLKNNNPPWLPGLRHRFLHFSAHCKRTALVIRPHKPRVYRGQRQRMTYRG